MRYIDHKIPRDGTLLNLKETADRSSWLHTKLGCLINEMLDLIDQSEMGHLCHLIYVEPG